jgi:hypothetical protein
LEIDECELGTEALPEPITLEYDSEESKESQQANPHKAEAFLQANLRDQKD